MALMCATAQADEPVAIYDPDPQHLWNRLYHSVAVRMEEGKAYGADISEPYHDGFDDTDRLLAVLDEFLENKGEERASGDLKRALFLNDMWAAFDLTVWREGTEPVQQRLASVIARLRMSSAAIAGLPDNYADAAETGGFAAGFDPARPESPFLPRNLFDPKGPWVQVGGEHHGVVAPTHVNLLSGRSAFLVFIRCPGGRQATVSYLERLNLYPAPWQVKPAPIGESVPGGERTRWDSLSLNAATPQFPEGTVVALVRQMLVIDDSLRPVATRVTQKVQFRVYKKIDAGAGPYSRSRFDASQGVHEFVMRRLTLLSGKSGGLHVVKPDEREYQLTNHDGEGRGQRARAPVVLSTCRHCHSGEGIFSVRSYARFPGGTRADLNPQLLPTEDIDYQHSATADWKQQQFNWGLLVGLIRGQTR